MFFIFYAVVSMGCVILWGEYGFTPDDQHDYGMWFCNFYTYQQQVIYMLHLSPAKRDCTQSKNSTLVKVVDLVIYSWRKDISMNGIVVVSKA